MFAWLFEFDPLGVVLSADRFSNRSVGEVERGEFALDEKSVSVELENRRNISCVRIQFKL